MQNKINSATLKVLSQITKENGFKKRGTSFFKINGDGVLQVIKPEYERNLPHWDLRIGLFSMYGTLDREWFTSGGCIPQYSICLMNGYSGPVVGNVINGELFMEIIDLGKQIELLSEKGFLFLDAIKTQVQLSKAINCLEEKKGSIRWNDGNKIAPYLVAENYSMAEKVIISILQQHGVSVQETSKESKSYASPRTSYTTSAEDMELQRILDWIQHNDRDAICMYLSGNVNRNMQYAKFMVK